jgi:hypothetical protein
MMNKKRMSLVGAAVLVVVAMGTQPLLAQSEGEESPPAEPGIPYFDDVPNLTESIGEPEAITTEGGTYDPTILTKFIPGSAFNPKIGDPGSPEADTLLYVNSSGKACVTSDTASGGALTELLAGVELPDGARVRQIVFYGEDNDAVRNILVQFGRTNIQVPPALVGGPLSRDDTSIASFTTSGHTGVVAVASPDNLDEVVGSSGSIVGGFGHRFHTVEVDLEDAAGANHLLCGVEVRYQVPTSAADPGTVFHPISPIRAFDSRNPVYPNSGLLDPNASKVISIKDGHDGAGVVNALDVVPAGATAIAYNITIGAPTGPNFVAVTPGDAATFLASAINFNGTADIANAGTVAIDANCQITVWGGDQSGSAHVIIDVTGYFVPPVPGPNMGN